MSDKELIWIVDDQPDFLNNLGKVLSSFFDVRLFETSEDLIAAIDKVSNSLPALLVSDLVLENDILLIDLLQTSQLKKLLAASRILVLSGNPSREIINSLLQLGAVDFISKPANIDELIVKINLAISKSRLTKNLSSYGFGISTDPIKREVHFDSQSVGDLTGREFQVLTAILESGVSGLSKKDLISEVWSGKAIDPSALSVHLTSLRRKIKSIGIYINYQRSIDTYSISIEDADQKVS